MNDIAKKDQPVITEPVSIQSALLDIVRREDIDPDRLERFLDLQIKMEDRQAEADFNAALAGFQAECPAIVKNKKVDFTSKSGNKTQYNYSALDEIAEVIRPVLAKYGLSYSFDLAPQDGGMVKLITIINHKSGNTRTSSYLFNDLHDDQRMNASQRRKSAVTYAKRAGLENALGIVTTEEDDDARRALDALQIKALVEETKTDMERFLRFMKVESIEEMDEATAKKAIAKLKEKRALNVPNK
jgi:hypothetical protein